MKLVLFILFPSICLAQHPLLTGAGIDWRRNITSYWQPNSPTNQMFIWLELTPTNSARALGSLATDPAPDNSKVTNWINLANISSSFIPQIAANAGTNFVSGGGPNSDKPRVFFRNNVIRRLTGSSFTMTNFTILMVIQCSAITDGTTEYVLADNESTPITPPWIRFNSNGKLEISAGTILTGPVSVGTGYNIIMATFAGASSSITTNGVAYVSGNIGTGGWLSTPLLFATDGPNPFPPFGGNISRIWVWTNSLNATDTANAIAQTKADFGFP